MKEWKLLKDKTISLISIVLQYNYQVILRNQKPTRVIQLLSCLENKHTRIQLQTTIRHVISAAL